MLSSTDISFIRASQKGMVRDVHKELDIFKKVIVDGRSTTNVATEYGLTAQRVSQLIARIIRMMKNQNRFTGNINQRLNTKISEIRENKTFWVNEFMRLQVELNKPDCLVGIKMLDFFHGDLDEFRRGLIVAVNSKDAATIIGWSVSKFRGNWEPMNKWPEDQIFKINTLYTIPKSNSDDSSLKWMEGYCALDNR